MHNEPVELSDDVIDQIFSAHHHDMQQLARELSDDQDIDCNPQAVLDAYTTFYNEAENALQPGMLAVLKPKMRITNTPKHNQPVVVIRFIDPIYDTVKTSRGVTCVLSTVDMEVGFLDPDGDWITCVVDKRRFMPFNPQETT